MSEFTEGKLIRDKLVGKFQGDKITTLSKIALEIALAKKGSKGMENFDSTDRKETVSQLAYLSQILLDIECICGISKDEVELERADTFNERGGFTGGNYIEPIGSNETSNTYSGGDDKC